MGAAKMGVVALNTFHPSDMVKEFIANPPAQIIVAWIDREGRFYTSMKVDDPVTALGMLEFAKGNIDGM
jgi:hypothetical protein